MTGLITKLLGLSAYTGLVAITLPHLQTLNLPSPSLKVLTDVLPFLQTASNSSTPAAEPFQCHSQNYTTQLVSLDPLVIYIHNFLSEADIPALLAAGEPAFKPSYVYKDGRRQGTPDRTSSSAGLPLDDAAVQCVLARAERFMGTTLAPGRDEMGPPQLVRYTAGQRFNVHHDWYDTFQPDRATGRERRWNRVASFFAILEDECVGGETWFPKVEAVAPQDKAKDGPWRRFEKGGLAFKPVRGNAVFWVNLHANGTGDERVVHAGLPLAEGLKTAMNIWPKRYIGPEAWGVREKEVVVDEAETDPA
ncbi:putative prolyl 4-hydroxylase 6 [Colletotrichum aenigma]|uniref:putative prolyl 4-hydroxylase 6 n=1 Tax=Colletotrichum aenigma TaxID=1215731 RepID=UPI001872C71E|nr:putative prolyl 4-hydroxylase 6 [Colletotrichum aenigma]KAF5521517.1 putative prolyl 4-hydroxylase 6 [Colletotrichum aenigma]